jgi:hypothetical protein
VGGVTGAPVAAGRWAKAAVLSDDKRLKVIVVAAAPRRVVGDFRIVEISQETQGSLAVAVSNPAKLFESTDQGEAR